MLDFRWMLAIIAILGIRPINADNELPAVLVNATVDPSLSIDVCVKANSSLHSPSAITGFKVYFTRNSIVSGDKYKQWQNVEVLTSEPQYCIRLDAHHYDIRPATVYRLRATALINQVESSPSKLVLVNTREAAAKSPVIQSVKVLANGSAIVQFIPAEDADVIANYTVEYRDVSSFDPSWISLEFESDSSSEVLLSGLLPNRTYETRLFVNGNVVHGLCSRHVFFSTNSTAQLPEVSLDAQEEIVLDPDVSEPFEVKCDVVASPPTSVEWLVDGNPLPHDHSFYTVTTETDNERITSTIRVKSRTRNDELTCRATNAAGQVSESVAVRIRGPGSPPTAVTLQSERGGYTVTWQPPSLPNGNITKYVIYHSFNKEYPLADWQKLVLDGTERSVRVLSESEDAFYVRLQAAADSGPGVISDIVAIEKDTIPISVTLQYESPSGREYLVAEPGEKIKAQCSAKGKPRPKLFYVVTEENEDPYKEDDVWRQLETTVERDSVVGNIEFTTLSTKVLHCKAKNTAGSNSSSLTFTVKKPGDAPYDIEVLSIDARDIIIVWKAPKFPNLKIESYELLLNEDVDDDEEYWQKYLTTAKDHSLVSTRLSLPTEQLKPSSDYYVRIRAINQAGSGPLSEPIQFKTPNGGPENPPTAVSVEINEANIAVLRWTRPNSTTEILNYVIYFTRDLGISNEDYHEWQTVEVPGDKESFKFDHQVGLKPKTFYRVRVSAKNDVAEGPVSETKEFETAHSELPIPTDVRTSVAEDNTVTITFSAVRDPDDHSNAIGRYKLEMAQSDSILNANWHLVNASSTSIDDMNSQVSMTIDGTRLARSSMYWVKITASLDNPTRFVQASKPRWFRTGDGRLRTRAEIEGAPVIEREPNLFDTLTIVCRAEGYPPPEITWFWNEALLESGKEGWKSQENQSERSSVSTLTRNSVRESGIAVCVATNEDGNATAQIQVRVMGPGSAPTNVQAVGWRNQINVSWQEPEIPNGVITRYIVYYALRNAEDLSEWTKLETDKTEIELPVTSPETRYLVRVQATTEDGPGIISDSVECYSDKHYQPIVMNLETTNVAEFEAEPGQTVTLRCSAQGQPIPRLFYSWDDDDESEITEVQIAENIHHISGSFEKKAFTNQTVVCRAENKHENIAIPKLLIVRKPGDAPHNITWSFDENDSLLINWDKVLYPNGNASYILYLSNFVERVAGPPVRIPEIPYNVNVTLQISAVNEWGEGAKSEPITFPTPNGGPRDAPSLTSLLSKDVKVTISWLPPTQPNGEIKGYTIYFKKNGETVDEPWQYVQVHANRTRFTIDETVGLEEDSHYMLKVSATNERHEGPASEVSWFDTYINVAEELPAPQNVTAYLQNTSLIVHIPIKHAYQDYVIYVRPEFSEQYWKYEAVNVTESQETLVIQHFPLDRNVSYRMKISGLKHGRESRSSEEFALMMEPEPTDTATTNSDEADESKNNAAEKRRLLKEPPL